MPQPSPRLCVQSREVMVAYPTETFYGLGVLTDSRDGLDRIITVKGRDAAKGMIVLVSDMTMASCIAVIGQ